MIKINNILSSLIIILFNLVSSNLHSQIILKIDTLNDIEEFYKYNNYSLIIINEIVHDKKKLVRKIKKETKEDKKNLTIKIKKVVNCINSEGSEKINTKSFQAYLERYISIDSNGVNEVFKLYRLDYNNVGNCKLIFRFDLIKESLSSFNVIDYAQINDLNEDDFKIHMDSLNSQIKQK